MNPATLFTIKAAVIGLAVMVVSYETSVPDACRWPIAILAAACAVGVSFTL